MALGGTTIAARGEFGASELDQLVIRQNEFSPSASGGHAEVLARCRKGEQFISGTGGWENVGGLPVATLSSISAVGRQQVRRPAGVLVIGDAPALNNTLVAQALCLPK